MVAWKEIEPFLGLALTTAFCASFHTLTKQEGAGKRTRKQGWPKDVMQRKLKVLAASTAGLVLGFIVLCGLLVLIKLPAKLQTTHPKVAEEKKIAREMCEHFMQDMDIVNAEVWIRNHTVSRALAKDFAAKQRQSIDRALRPIVNQVFFRIGAMCAVLPIVVVLGIQLACHLAKWRVPKWFPSPADTTFVLLPLVQMACAYTWAVAVCFHFWLRERQVTNCMLLSGHWYTALHTLVAAVAVAAWLRFECNGVDHGASPGERRWTATSSALPLYYVAWVVAYIALTSRTLSTSQQFHHDWQESVEGIKCMIMTLPITALAAAFTLYVSLDRAQLELAEDPSSTPGASSPAGAGAPQNQSSDRPLAPKQTAEVLQSFESQGETELPVSVGALVRVLELPNSGWIYAQRADGKTGYVPESFLMRSSKEFISKVPSAAAASTSSASSVAADVAAGDAASTTSSSAAPASPAKQKVPTRSVPFLDDIRKGTAHLKKHTSQSSLSSQSTDKSSKPQGMMGALAERIAQRREQIDPPEDSTDSEWK